MLLQVLTEGLLMGGIYAIAALGLSLIFGVMKITNFAHGALMTVGMYVVYVAYVAFGLSPYMALPLSMICLFLIGYLIQRVFIQKIENAPNHNQLLLTLGLSIIIENTLLAIFKPDAKSEVFEAYSKSVTVLGIKVNVPKLISLFVVLLVTLLIYLLLYKTEIGRSIRATSMDREGALLVGIVVKKTNALAFGIGAMCTGIAGALLTPTLNIDPTIGNTFQLTCFVIAVLGGMGNIWGALISGFLIGLLESVTSFYLSGSLSSMAIYAVFILVLIFKPTGLFERRARRD